METSGTRKPWSSWTYHLCKNIILQTSQQKPKNVSLVCMGYACEYPTDEDTLCAEYISNELNGKKNNFEAMVEKIRNGTGKRFFDPTKQEWSPMADFDLCLNLNRFNFVLKVDKNKELNYLHRIEV